MHLVAAFFRDKTPPRLLMIAALILLTLSQFFAYFDDPTTGFLSIHETFDTAALYRIAVQGTGWDLHPQAYLILAAIAFALLRDDVADHPMFRRFGFWVCLVLIFAAISPGAPIRAVGAAMGGIAFLMGLVAAIWNQLLPRMETRFSRKAPPKA